MRVVSIYEVVFYPSNGHFYVDTRHVRFYNRQRKTDTSIPGKAITKAEIVLDVSSIDGQHYKDITRIIFYRGRPIGALHRAR